MKDVIFVLMLCAGYLASNKLNECPTTQKILHCENMVTSKGFAYHVPQNMTVYLRDRHCEHGWYDTNGTFIVDSTIDGEKLGSVVAVTPQNLTLSTCASLQWQIQCDNIQFHCTINYTVKHRATHDFLPENYTFTGDKDAISLNWLIAVIVGSVVVSATILSVTIWVFWEKIVRRSDYTPGEGGSEILNFECPSHKGHPYL